MQGYHPRVTTPADFLRLALDPVRLAVLGHAAHGSVDVDQVADSLETDPRTVREAIGRLRAANLLDDDYRLDTDALRSLAAALPHQPPADPAITAGAWSGAETEILTRFFAGARLVSIPSQHSKRKVVLERLAQEFEPGVRYEEAEVNFRLQLFHADYAALRRYLVDDGFLTRADGVYWRTGGRFDEPSLDGGD